MARGKSLLLGLFVGGVVSAGVTLLNAPKSGKESRADIKNQVDELKCRIENLKEDCKELSEQFINVSKESAKIIKDLTVYLKVYEESMKNTIVSYYQYIIFYL